MRRPRRYLCPSAQSSFGLTIDTTGAFKEIIWEEIFSLVQHCRIDFTEAWDMPVFMRTWWFQRIEKMREEIKKQNTPQNPGHVDPFGRSHGK